MFDSYHIDNHRLLNQILKGVGHLMITTEALVASQARLVADVETLLTAFGKAQADLATATAALAAAIAANDPVAMAAAQAQIDAVAQALGDEAAKVEAANPAPAPAPEPVPAP